MFNIITPSHNICKTNEMWITKANHFPVIYNKLMDDLAQIWQKLDNNSFKISTDTRKELDGTIFFALKGESFDGNTFVEKALKKGAVAVVSQNPQFKSTPNVYVVDDTLRTLQTLAQKYRETFTIPIIAVGGSNGKTTSRELIRCVLETNFKVHTTESNLNNEIGVPLSILAMDKDTEIGVFEIGANHAQEHTNLLEILRPTHVIVTNNGLDHLEGFGSPTKVIEANEEINKWARKHNASIIANVEHGLKVSTPLPLSISLDNKEYQTKMVGNYNLENISRALTVGKVFKINLEKALTAISAYTPMALRSELLERNGAQVIVDCYNANPSSMMLALKSFIESCSKPRGVILGDMLELGPYAEEEHKKILDFVSKQELNIIVLIGEQFRQAQENSHLNYTWFPNSSSAQKWFRRQNFTNYTLLLKGSRGIKVEEMLLI